MYTDSLLKMKISKRVHPPLVCQSQKTCQAVNILNGQSQRGDLRQTLVFAQIRLGQNLAQFIEASFRMCMRLRSLLKSNLVLKLSILAAIQRQVIVVNRKTFVNKTKQKVIEKRIYSTLNFFVVKIKLILPKGNLKFNLLE